MAEPLTLASKSRIRSELLRNAGLEFETMGSGVDEDSAKLSMRAEGFPPKDQAMFLAEMKATRVSSNRAGLIIGADQMLSIDGQAHDKPKTKEDAKARLQYFSGKAHYLESAIVIAKDGQPIWRHINRPKLIMRSLSEEFIDHYLDEVGDSALESVGAYQLEGPGVQLFQSVEGDYFSILGLPLIELLTYLRDRGVLKS